MAVGNRIQVQGSAWRRSQTIAECALRNVRCRRVTDIYQSLPTSGNRMAPRAHEGEREQVYPVGDRCRKRQCVEEKITET